jgi:septum formation protein
MPLWRAADPLVLASRSEPRRAMLEAAGVPIEVRPARIDERAVEAAAGPLDPAAAAAFLASEKAKSVARDLPQRLVVGADQTLSLGSRRFDKPKDRGAAHAQLMMLAGHTHRLHTAVAVVSDGEVVFSHTEDAVLSMRKLSAAFLDTYLDAAGAAALGSVGAYQLERLGVHLFDHVEGDHFTILGLPLLQLLAFLRHQGSLSA